MVVSASFPEPPIATEPGKGSLDHPASWLHSEADLAGSWPHDLDRHRVGPTNPFALIAMIGEDTLYEGEAVTRCAGQWTGAVTILDRCRADDDREQSTVGIDHGMAFTTDDPLSPVVAAAACLVIGAILLVIPSGSGRDDVYLTRKRDRDYRPPELEDRRDPYL